MADNWGGFKNGQIPLPKMLKVEGEYFEPTAGRAVVNALAEIRKAGVAVHINEGYRPLGVPNDQNIRNEAQTSTHGSNQWFQYGRMKRGETPAAAYPGGSVHGWGKAIDVSPGRDNATVKRAFERQGFSFNIASEPWHATFIKAPASTPEPSTAEKGNWKRLQGYLKKYWGYTGAIDGAPGPLTWKACQRWLQAHHGYTGAIDGVPGPLTYAALRRAGSSLH